MISLFAFLPLAAKLPLFIIGTATLVSEIYTRLPQMYIYGSLPPLLNESLITINTDKIFLLFHGAGGEDANTDNIIKSAKNIYKNENQYIQAYNWKPWCGNLLRAALDSDQVGRRIGQQLAQINSNRPVSKQLKRIHVVGVSVGAFAADSCITAFARESKKLNKQSINNKPPSSSSSSSPSSASSSSSSSSSSSIAAASTFLKLTLLDPFCSRGLYDSTYGVKQFGQSSDFCEQYLNTDDVVPFTNDPVHAAYCYDVTQCKERLKFTPLSGDNMHSWPGNQTTCLNIPCILC